jgi:RAP1 GTPase activating protein 1
MNKHPSGKSSETNIAPSTRESHVISPVLLAYYSQFPDVLRHRDSFDALGLGNRNLGTFSIKVFLPDINQTEKQLEIPLRYTVDKVKAAIFNNEELLRNESMLDYQLAISEDERLEVEFVRLSECHEVIRRAVALNKTVELYLLPKNRPRAKALKRSLSQQNVRHKVERLPRNLPPKNEAKSDQTSPASTLRVPNTKTSQSQEIQANPTIATKKAVVASEGPTRSAPPSLGSTKDNTTSNSTAASTSASASSNSLPPSSVPSATTDAKKETIVSNTNETPSQHERNSKIIVNLAESSSTSLSQSPTRSESSQLQNKIVVTQPPPDDTVHSSQEIPSTKKGFFSKLYEQSRSLASAIASPRILLRRKQTKADKHKHNASSKSVAFSSSPRMSNASNSTESSEDANSSFSQVDAEVPLTRDELCPSLELQVGKKRKEKCRHPKKRIEETAKHKSYNVDSSKDLVLSQKERSEISDGSHEPSAKQIQKERISIDSRPRSSSFAGDFVNSEPLVPLPEEHSSRLEMTKEEAPKQSKHSRSKSRERKPQKSLYRQESDTATITRHRHRIRHSKEKVTDAKNSSLEKIIERGSEASLSVPETRVDKTKPRQRSQSRTDSEESVSETIKRHEVNKMNTNPKEEIDEELEVANDEEIDYRVLALSRTGTLRAYKKEAEVILNKSTPRARSNSVLVSSGSSVDFFSKRKIGIDSELNKRAKETIVDEITFSGYTFEPSRVEKLRRGSFSLVEVVGLVNSEGRDSETTINLPILMRPCKGYWVEATNKLLPKDYMSCFFEIDNAANDVLWYQKYFVENEHQNYFGRDENLGPYIVSVMKDINPSNDNSKLIRVLLRTKKGDERRCIRDKFISTKSKSKLFKFGSTPSIETILKSIKPSLNRQHIKLVKNPELIVDLQNFEARLMVRSYKFGILFCKEGQTREEEMFSNEHGNEAFETFLTFLGQKIRLQGWNKYRGGLDIQCDTTGLYSIFTEFRGFEIMFHVSTFLPYTPENPQQVERKRHIGNDIVVLIFKEGNTPYLPNTITSEYNHVYLVVAPVSVNGKLHYQLACGSKDGVPSFGPEIPEPPLFEPNDYFRDFLICKMINGERAAYKSVTFAKKIQRTRLTLLEELQNKYV